MNGCLRCVSMDVEDEVAHFYTQLQFEPWDVFARKRYDENTMAGRPPRELERQTGRTTHGILEALAYCSKNGLTELGVSAKPVFHVACSFSARLNLPVMPRPTVHSSMYAYEDHFHG